MKNHILKTRDRNEWAEIVRQTFVLQGPLFQRERERESERERERENELISYSAFTEQTIPYRWKYTENLDREV